MTARGRILTALSVVLLLAPRSGFAQERGAVALAEQVRGLGNTVRVMMIGAHPDDEDTQLITWLARGRRVETAYLSLTRGDGGQNLIGNELGPALGVLRTEELLAARRIDGGHQFFTRAYDFGFSKNVDETWKHWPHDSLLKDVVTIVRAYRPHVIIAVFSGTARDGHGQHTASGILAREVFDAAADTVRFPVTSTGGIGPWTPLKFYRAARFNPAEATLPVNVGEYNQLLGRSYAEIAGESRSQHLSQAFGTFQPKGARLDYLKLEESRVGAVGKEPDLFQGIDTTWARVAGAAGGRARRIVDSLAPALAAVEGRLHVRQPRSVVPALARYVQLTREAADSLTRTAYFKDPRAGQPGFCTIATVPQCGGVMGDLVASLLSANDRAGRALLEAAGIAIEANAPREMLAMKDTLPVSVDVYARDGVPVTITGVTLSIARGAVVARDSTRHAVVPDSMGRVTLPLLAGIGSQPTAPWWLMRNRNGDTFRLEPERSHTSTPVPELVLGEDRLQDVAAGVRLDVAGAPVVTSIPIVYKYADPAKGEQHRPVAVAAPASVSFPRGLAYLPANRRVIRPVRVYVTSAAATPHRVRVKLMVPEGMTVDTAVKTITLQPFTRVPVEFRLTGTMKPGEAAVATSAEDSTAGVASMAGYVMIDYPHIRPQRFYRQALMGFEIVDVNVPAALNVAYVQGPADEIPPMLRDLGIPVTVLDTTQLQSVDLSKYTTVVVGPRAYESSAAVYAAAPRFMEFVRRGGTLVVQYGQSGMQRPGIFPHPLTPGTNRTRVTEEDAKVTILNPTARLLEWPNRITEADFTDWVQERATYLPTNLDPAYQRYFEMHDENEPASESSVITAKVGKGTFVYTSLVFFRELPNGVPGAARLFVNLLSAGLAR